jgi:hypothetical protein
MPRRHACTTCKVYNSSSVSQRCCSAQPRIVCGIQACDNRPMPRGSRRLSPEDHHPEVPRAACRLEPRGGSMTRRRYDGQGTTVASHLPHPSTAAPRLLPKDPPGDVSPYTVGAEGYPAWAHLAGASDVLVGAHAMWQHDGNETRQRGQTRGTQRPRDFFGVRRYRRRARQGIQRVV